MTNHQQATLHPLDDALQLETTPADEPGVYTGHTTKAYWNMVGPYGGITAATLLQAVLKHPQLLGDPLSLTVNFAGAVTEGPFTIKAKPIRTNRSTQHWFITLEQVDKDGVMQVATTATAKARDTASGASPSSGQANSMARKGCSSCTWLTRSAPPQSSPRYQAKKPAHIDTVPT